DTATLASRPCHTGKQDYLYPLTQPLKSAMSAAALGGWGYTTDRPLLYGGTESTTKRVTSAVRQTSYLPPTQPATARTLQRQLCVDDAGPPIAADNGPQGTKQDKHSVPRLQPQGSRRMAQRAAGLDCVLLPALVDTHPLLHETDRAGIR
ncbi:Hypothetical predicted protein, partial [Pelobates cultripes]